MFVNVEDPSLIQCAEEHVVGRIIENEERERWRGFVSEPTPVDVKRIPRVHGANRSVVLRSTVSDTVSIAQGGAAKITVHEGVAPGAAFVAYGGSAGVVIFGDVAENACIVATGGASHITIFGDVAEGAYILADGASARVTIFGNVNSLEYSSSASDLSVTNYRTSSELSKPIVRNTRIAAYGASAEIVVYGQVADRESSLFTDDQTIVSDFLPRFLVRVLQSYYRCKALKSM